MYSQLNFISQSQNAHGLFIAIGQKEKGDRGEVRKRHRSWPTAVWIFFLILQKHINTLLRLFQCFGRDLCKRGVLTSSIFLQFSSLQFSCSVVSDSLQPHELQHARPPGVHSDSHPLSQWCHPAISSSVVPFSSCPQSLPASESFPMSQLFTWGGQSTGVSALASFLPKKSQLP